ncbi:hypothetical protein D9758_011586 [Tetrapyrgos nigripes]|uniref:PPM-type phosphatase domain-containing protein n=1 Tax=Tetrapyrgos nigripes TaxID=182062 RepID=A0A8H5FQ17_9AGAR|nr:hypothetical protein D9758_011586 [Tetrapyrgos nigripes]
MISVDLDASSGLGGRPEAANFEGLTWLKLNFNFIYTGTMPFAPPSRASREELDTVFEMIGHKSFHTLSDNNTRIFQSTFQGKKPRNEDRSVFYESSLGTIVAIFDGHHSDELSEYASKTLPALLCERIQKTLVDEDRNLDHAVRNSLSAGIEDFDRSLLQGFYDIWPKKDQTDWDDPLWLDPGEVFEVIGYSRVNPKFQRARYAVVGSTALVVFIDKAKENVWVASLGDSEAVVGKMKTDGAVLRSKRLNDFHNGKDEKEVQRLNAEHPDEPPVIKYGRVFGSLAVTRALGNHQLKAPLNLAAKILLCAYPAPFGDDWMTELAQAGHVNRPYISSTPSIQHHVIDNDDVLVLYSDGLGYELRNLDEKDKLDLVVTAAAADHALPEKLQKVWSDKLGHRFIAPKAGDNLAERVIKNVCFGTDSEKMIEAIAPSSEPWDDITVVVHQHFVVQLHGRLNTIVVDEDTKVGRPYGAASRLL